MKPIANTRPAASWSALSQPERDLITRLTLSRRKDGGLVVDGILATKLPAADRETADRLLERKLVDYRDLVLRATALGLRVVVLESGLMGRTG